MREREREREMQTTQVREGEGEKVCMLSNKEGKREIETHFMHVYCVASVSRSVIIISHPLIHCQYASLHSCWIRVIIVLL